MNRTPNYCNFTQYPDGIPDFFDPYWCQWERPSQTTLTLFGTAVAMINLLSVVGNGVVVYTMLRSPVLRQKKLFTINLSLSDLISPLLTYWMFTVSSMEGIWVFSENACRFYACIQGWFGLMSITTLAAIAAERCLSMTHPHTKWGKMNNSMRMRIIVAIWIYCFFASAPPAFGFSRFVPQGFMTTCCFDYISHTPDTLIFILFLFVFGLMVPMSVIMISYFKIWHLIRQQTIMEKERAKTATRTTTMDKISATQRGLNSFEMIQSVIADTVVPSLALSVNDTDMDKLREDIAPRRRFRRRDLIAAQIGLMLVAIFLIAWSPYSLMALLGQFGPKNFVTPWLAMVPSVFAKSSTLYNPIIYAVKDSRFKKAFKRYILNLPECELNDTTTATSGQPNQRI